MVHYVYEIFDDLITTLQNSYEPIEHDDEIPSKYFS